MAPFNKFAWLRRVLADAQIPDGQRAVLAFLAIEYADQNGTNIHVRQVTVAEQMGAAERTVRRAFKAGRDMRYLSLTQTRQRGRAHRGADYYRLSYPSELPATQACIDAEIAATDDTNSGQKCTEIAANANSVTCEKVPDKRVFNQGSKQGSDPPPEFCPQHPRGTRDDCGACGTARVAHAAWKQDLKAARRAEIDACPDCDHNGLRETSDGMTRCHGGEP
jgi:hypothetical protein